MENRRNAIVEMINNRGHLSFAQLKAAFPQVSEMTLRTDLKVLDQTRRIVRIHGGAKSVNMVIGTDGLLGLRTARNADAKEIIAQKALQFLRANTSVYLDSGSTVTALARLIPDDSYLIFTNALSCATELAKLKIPRVTMLGGILNCYSMSLCGTQSIRAVEKINFDTMFLGVTSYSPSSGFSCGVEEESLLKQAVMRRSEQVVVLMDSSKIGLTSTYSICGLEDVNVIISDGNLPEDFLEACRQYHVTVY
jgi:DeoR family transcriptional regulator of aga operon